METIGSDPTSSSHKPRNWKRFNEGQKVSAIVRGILERHSPLDAPLTAKQIIQRLPAGLRRSETAIQWHMRKIREHSNTLRLPQFIGVVR